MTQYLFLRILDLEHAAREEYQAQWLLSDAEGSVLRESENAAPLSGIAGDLPAADKDRMTVVLLPGHAVLLRQVQVKPQHLKHVGSAIATAIEEQLAEAVEEVHIAYAKTAPAAGEPRDSHFYQAAVIADALMRRLTTSLQAAGFSADAVISEAMLLDGSTDQAVIAVDGGQCLFCLSSHAVSSLEKDAFPLFLEKYLTRSVPPVTALRVVAPENAQAAEVGFIDRLRTLCAQHGCAMHGVPTRGTFLRWLGGQWFSQPQENRAVNLLQGAYRARGRTYSFADFNWKEMALIVLAWMMAQSFFDMVMAAYLRYETTRLEAESAELYHRVFPQDRKIVDIKAQMSQHMRSLSAAAGADEFTLLVGVLAGNAELLRHLDIRSLDYDAGQRELSVDLASDDFNTLEQYKHLGTKEGVVLKLDSVVREQNEVRCRMKIRRP